MLLRHLAIPFRAVRSAYHETIRRGESPSANAMRNALGKARKAKLPRNAKGVVIGADTFLCFRGRVMGKPKTLRQAQQWLRALSGRHHWVYTGLCVLDLETGQCRTSYEQTKVTFKKMSPETISRYLARVSPLDKAGGYAVQEDRGVLIARMKGSRSNVIGLPLELLRRELRVFRRII